MAIAILGIIGDLFESMLKRSAGIKDIVEPDPGPRRHARSHRRAAVRLPRLRLLFLRYAGLVETRCFDPKRLAILGSTGSIGHSALAVVDAHPDRLRVVGLAAGDKSTAIAPQMERYRPRAVAMATGAACETLRGSPAGAAATSTCAAPGREALIAVARTPTSTLVLCASSGTAALEAVLAAIDAGKRIALANKEVLVMAGALVMDAGARARRRRPAGRQRAQRHPPVPARRDPSRSAPADPDRVGRAVPAACPPRRWPAVTAADALSHPTWRMGPQDHHRLGDADEQGPRGDRGALAVRRRRRSRSTWSSIRNRSSIRWSS